MTCQGVIWDSLLDTACGTLILRSWSRWCKLIRSGPAAYVFSLYLLPWMRWLTAICEDDGDVLPTVPQIHLKGSEFPLAYIRVHILSRWLELKATVTRRSLGRADSLLGLEIRCVAVNESRLQLKCEGTRWRMRGGVKGKLANGVGSQYSSHFLGTWCIQHYYRWCADIGCQ